MTRIEVVIEVAQVLAVAGIIVALLLGACAGPANASPEAGIAYRWLDRYGTYCWTDDADQVPEAYRAEVRRVVLGKLADYPRYTKAPQVELGD